LKFDDFIDNSIHECLNADADMSYSRNYTTYNKEDSSTKHTSLKKPYHKDDAIGLSDLESSTLNIPEVQQESDIGAHLVANKKGVSSTYLLKK